MSDRQTTAPTTVALTLADAKRHLNVSSTFDDTYIGDIVSAATLALENRSSRCFINQTRTLKMLDFDDERYVHDRVIYPPRSPLSSVSSVKYVDTDGTTQTISSSDYVVTADQPGTISEALNATWPVTYGDADDVTIVYVTGHSSATTGVPANVKQAVRMLAAHWYRNREAVITGTISKEIELAVDACLESERMESYG